MAEGKAISRRDLLKRAGVGAGGLAVAGAAAPQIWAAPRVSEDDQTIKIGFVSPLTGPASGFGEPDPYVLGLAKKALAGGLTIGGTKYAVQVINKDAQSTPSVAAQVASDLIHSESVDLMLTTSTPEVVNPVSDACEAAGVPCISTVVPWEAWYFGRGAKPGKPSPFRFTYHFCFGVANFFDTYTHLWPQIETNKVVGVMWPNDADGNAIRGALGPLLEKAGYKIIDPGAYTDGTTDYTAQITKFKQAGIQIFNTFPIPPDFATFWRQAAQQGLTKQVKIAQIAKTGLFASQVSALGKLGVQPRERCLLGPDLALPLAAHRDLEQGARLRLHDSEPQAVEPADGPEPRALRRRRRRAQGERQSEGQDRGRERDEDAERDDAGRPAPLEQGPRAERRPDPDSGRSVDQGEERPVPVRVGLLRAHRRPQRPDSGEAQALQLARARGMEGSEAKPILAAAGIHRRFGALVVLDGVDFAVGAGDAIGIVGPNGAGKTTLLNILSGALRPSEGSVAFRGEDVTRSGVSRRCRLGIGRAHQVPKPFGDMTVFENVYVGSATGGGLRGQAAYARCIEVLELCALTGLANRRAESLGLLDRKKLELARALGTNPVGAAARRDRCRAHRRRGRRARRDDPPGARSGCGDRLDRAHRAGARADRRAPRVSRRGPRDRRRGAGCGDARRGGRRRVPGRRAGVSGAALSVGVRHRVETPRPVEKLAAHSVFEARKPVSDTGFGARSERGA